MFAKKNQPGFMLMMTFFGLALLVTLVTYYLHTTRIYTRFGYVFYEREKVKMLARSGITIALSQLSLADSKLIKDLQKNDQESLKNQKDPVWRKKQLCKILLTVCNRWQTFECTEKDDGIEGTIQIAITAEDGKIPLSKLINYEKHDFEIFDQIKKTGGKEILKDFFDRYKKYANGKDLFESFEQWLKKTDYYLVDVTQLLIIESFKDIRNTLFFIPPAVDQKEQSLSAAFTDCVSIERSAGALNPFLFSESVKQVYGFDKGKKFFSSEQIDEIIEKVSLDSIKWDTVWDTYCKDVYGKNFQGLPEGFSQMLSTKFEPNVFSVVCYAKVGKIEQKLVAIIVRNFSQNSEVFEIKKLYWL